MGSRAGKGIAVLVFGILTVMTIPTAVSAAGFSSVNVEYSADRLIGSDDGVMEGKVYYAPGKERNEMSAGEAVMIMRLDRKVMWMLTPKEQMYMEHKFGEGRREKGDYRECDVRQTDAGEEVVNGVRTKKRTVDIACPDREKFSGTVWMTRENIVMKMETAEKGGGSKKKTYRMELKNLKIGKQDPALFEIPSGYRKMEIPSMGDVQKMMKEQSAQEEAARERAAQEQARKKAARKAEEEKAETGRSYTAQPREKSAVDQVLDPAKKIKNLLRW